MPTLLKCWKITEPRLYCNFVRFLSECVSPTCSNRYLWSSPNISRVIQWDHNHMTSLIKVVVQMSWKIATQKTLACCSSWWFESYLGQPLVHVVLPAQLTSENFHFQTEKKWGRFPSIPCAISHRSEIPHAKTITTRAEKRWIERIHQWGCVSLFGFANGCRFSCSARSRSFFPAIFRSFEEPLLAVWLELERGKKKNKNHVQFNFATWSCRAASVSASF